jgi:hypothetical protein
MKRGLILGLALVAGAPLVATERLLFDDYYQHPRDNAQYGQGVARGDAELRGLSNFYAPGATGIPNGTFVFAELIADKFTTEVSDQPISAELLEGVGAYLLVCPVRESFGGRADLTAQEADVLEAFVADGGSLVLVANSITDPEKSGMNFAGLNLIGSRFGAEFIVSQTDTILVPIPPEHAVFDDVANIIFGNGALIEIADAVVDNTTVLMTSHREGAEGPVAVLIEHGQGKVILLGDAGTLGSAHAFRGDTGHAEGLRQMMLALLPDGPMSRYGWQDGTGLDVAIREEQVISGYPEFMDVFRLPYPDGVEVFSSGMRQIDLEASGGESGVAESKDFVSVVAARQGTLALNIEAGEAGHFSATWQTADQSMTAPLRPNGRQGPPSLVREGDLQEWGPVVLNELIAAPLRTYAQPGDDWSARVAMRQPHLQLAPLASYEPVEAGIEFLGEADHEGIPCYHFKQVVERDGGNWELGDLVDDAYAAQIQARGLTVQAGGILTVSEFWIHRETHLPVHTRVSSTAAVWWQDPRFPDRYVGSHDSKNYEDWETTNFVATYGRVLSADFVPQP